MKTNPALSALRHHVSGAIARGEAQAITEVTAPASVPIHARQAIVTRYLGPTDTRPSRIRASCDRGSLTISMPLEYSGADAHAVAVRELLANFALEDGSSRSWPAFERWVCGGMPQSSKDAYVWVQLPAPFSAAVEALGMAEATLERLAPAGSRATQGTRDVIRQALGGAL